MINLDARCMNLTSGQFDRAVGTLFDATAGDVFVRGVAALGTASGSSSLVRGQRTAQL